MIRIFGANYDVSCSHGVFTANTALEQLLRMLLHRSLFLFLF